MKKGLISMNQPQKPEIQESPSENEDDEYEVVFQGKQPPNRRSRA